MSLIRQLWLLLLGTMAIALIGSVAVNAGAARAYLQTQLALKNSDNAQALALSLSLSSQPGDAALLELAIAAQFDTGAYEHIRLTAPDGRALVNKQSRPAPAEAPAWFVQLLPITAAPGVAQVSDGWRPVGTLSLASATGFAHAHLWQGTLRSTGWLLFVGALAGVLAGLALRRIRAPLDATVAQAQALTERRFVTVSEPRVTELRQVSRAMNAMVERLQAMFSEQGAQLEALRRQAQTDALTGLSNRAHFMASLQALGRRDDAPAQATLLLLRVRSLAQLNQTLGHAAADALLKALARAIDGPQPAVQAPGRLNGSDFALLLVGPEGSAAVQHQLDAVRAALAPWPGACVAAGGTAWAPGMGPGALMQAADAALVQAEAQPGFALVVNAPRAGPTATPVGEAEWRRRLEIALQKGTQGTPGGASLGAFAVVRRDGSLLHVECPLRLQLVDGGPLEPAAQWLPWALRCGLSPAVDGLALALALQRSAADGQARCVNLAPDSLHDSGFVASLRAQLQAQPRAAGLLWLELAESAATGQLDRVRELGRQLRPLGVKVGIEHAGADLAGMARLYEAGLDYVKLEAALSLGIHTDPARASFVRGLIGSLKSLGLQVMAEGVVEAADAQALWQGGIDAITGPVIALPAAPAQPG